MKRYQSKPNSLMNCCWNPDSGLMLEGTVVRVYTLVWMVVGIQTGVKMNFCHLSEHWSLVGIRTWVRVNCCQSNWVNTEGCWNPDWCQGELVSESLSHLFTQAPVGSPTLNWCWNQEWCQSDQWIGVRVITELLFESGPVSDWIDVRVDWRQSENNANSASAKNLNSVVYCC